MKILVEKGVGVQLDPSCSLETRLSFVDGVDKIQSRFYTYGHQVTTHGFIYLIVVGPVGFAPGL